MVFSSSVTQASNVGNYVINGDGLTANNGNYTFTQAAGNATALSITKAPLTLAGTLSGMRIYGNANNTITYSYPTVSGAKLGQTINVASGTVDPSVTNASGANTYSGMLSAVISGSGVEMNNYSYTNPTGTLTINTVTPIRYSTVPLAAGNRLMAMVISCSPDLRQPLSRPAMWANTK